MNETTLIEQSFLRTDVPEFRPGDTVKVHVRVVEGNRERVQVFQGVVIRRQGGSIRETFTVRKISLRGRRGAHVPGALAVDRQARGRSAGAPFVGPSSTTCATCEARRPASRSAGSTTPSSPPWKRPLPPGSAKPLTTTTRCDDTDEAADAVEADADTAEALEASDEASEPMEAPEAGEDASAMTPPPTTTPSPKPRSRPRPDPWPTARPAPPTPVEPDRTTRPGAELPAPGPDRDRPRDHHQELPGAGVLHPVAVDGADPSPWRPHPGVPGVHAHLRHRPGGHPGVLRSHIRSPGTTAA